MAARSAIINRPDRITGDGAIHAASKLVRNRKRVGCDGVYDVISRFAEYQTRLPENKTPRAVVPPTRPDFDNVLDGLIGLAADCRHGL